MKEMQYRAWKKNIELVNVQESRVESRFLSARQPKYSYLVRTHNISAPFSFQKKRKYMHKCTQVKRRRSGLRWQRSRLFPKKCGNRNFWTTGFFQISTKKFVGRGKRSASSIRARNSVFLGCTDTSVRLPGKFPDAFALSLIDLLKWIQI